TVRHWLPSAQERDRSVLARALTGALRLEAQVAAPNVRDDRVVVAVDHQLVVVEIPGIHSSSKCRSCDHLCGCSRTNDRKHHPGRLWSVVAEERQIPALADDAGAAGLGGDAGVIARAGVRPTGRAAG